MFEENIEEEEFATNRRRNKFIKNVLNALEREEPLSIKQKKKLEDLFN